MDLRQEVCKTIQLWATPQSDVACEKNLTRICCKHLTHLFVYNKTASKISLFQQTFGPRLLWGSILTLAVFVSFTSKSDEMWVLQKGRQATYFDGDQIKLTSRSGLIFKTTPDVVFLLQIVVFCDSCPQIIVDCVSNIAVNNKRRSGLKGAGQVSYSIQTPLTHKNRCNDVPTGETGRSWKNV